MVKILAVFDGLCFSESTLQYAVDLAKTEHAHLTGIFLDDFLYNSFNLYTVLYKEGKTEKDVRKLHEKDLHTRTKAAERFAAACEAEGIAFNIRHDRSIALQELLHESMYADLLVIDEKETFAQASEAIPTRFVRELLATAQCPVLVVPQLYTPIHQVLLLYDGAPSSVWAVRMFAYLLQGMQAMPVTVLSVKEEKESLHLPDNHLMKEFMKRHFPAAAYTVLKGDAVGELIKALRKVPTHTLVVLGAYSRGTVSRWFKPSMADVLMKEPQLQLPMLIAHTGR